MIGFVVGMLFIGVVLYFWIIFLTKGERMIEGIPEGWELLGVRCAEPLEKFIGDDGSITTWTGKKKSSRVLPVIRKIEKPKKYRPFANAEEFEPFRDRWMTHPENTFVGQFKVLEFNDSGIWCNGMKKLMPYETAYKIGLRFDDGTPFGIEVTE